jgi:hypothetical protein
LSIPISARTALTAGLAALLTAVLAAGCSSAPGGPAVFTATGGFSSRFPLHTDEVGNIGLNYGSLDNTTGSPVRLTGVSFVDPPAALKMGRVYAVSFADSHDTGVISEVGVLYLECPHFFRAHPLSVVTIRPHSSSRWLVIVSFTFSRPGVYHLNRVRVDYTTAGRHGWQDQSVNTTATVRNPPRPGPIQYRHHDECKPPPGS